MKVIFVNRYFYPDISATSKVVSDLAMGLAQKGLKIHVVTSRQRLDEPSAKLASHEIAHGVHIHRVWSSSFGRSNLLLRFFDYLTFYGSAFWKLMWIASSKDVVVAMTDPPLLSIAAMEAVFWKRAKLINWNQDLFPEVAEKLGLRIVRMLSPFIKPLRNLSLKFATKNVVIGQAMGSRLSACGVERSKIELIFNWADGEKIKPVEAASNPLRKQWGFEGKWVVGYSGNMGRAHEFETILDASGDLINREDIVFLLIGNGKKREWLENEVKRRNLKNVFFKPLQPDETLALSLGVSDIHLVTLEPSLEGLIVPSKIYGILAAGRPTIYVGDTQSEISELLATHHCGASVSRSDSKKLASQICAWVSDRDILSQMGRNARHVFEEKFDKPLALAQWAALIRNVQ